MRNWRDSRLRLAGLVLLLLPFTRASGQELQPSGIQQIQAILEEKAQRTPAQRKLSSHLHLSGQIARGIRTAANLPAFGAMTNGLAFDGAGGVHVDIRATVNPALLREIATLGGRVESSFVDEDSIRAWVPLLNLERLAGRSDVNFIRPAEKYILQARLPPRQEALRNQLKRVLPLLAGRRLSSGLGLFARPINTKAEISHGADLAQLAGITGTGIKVGVLSDGVKSLSTLQAAGNLPAVTVLAGQAGSGDEGTAMLEIIYDLAPGATLYFATANSGSSQFANNIKALAAAGCKIIVDDVHYLSEGAFQDGVIAQAVNTVTAAGALYLSAAGNSGNLDSGTSGTWEGDFVSSGTTLQVLNNFEQRAVPIHSFDASHNYDAVTSKAPPACSGDCPTILQWSDPLHGACNDYDLFVLDSSMSTIKDFSADYQTCTQDPYEQTGGGPGSGDRIVVVLYTGAPRALRIDTLGGRLSIATAGSISGHNGAAAALSVAATPAQATLFTSGNQSPEFYSSDGPRKIFYNANGTAITPGNVLFGSNGGTTLPKVDFTAADCGQSALPVFNPFCGTSAAAPTAAAIAALAWSTDLSQTAAQVAARLKATALPAHAGFGARTVGSGIVMATIPIPGPDLTITLTHTGNFGQGQPGAYTITVSNSGGGPTSAQVTLTDALPSGLTAASISGNGWNCSQPAGPCTRSDALAPGASYPAVILNVNVANNAPTTVTNTATVSGGGENNTSNNTASDAATVTPLLSDLTIAKTHTGNFSPGQTGATYTITVTNSGAGATNGLVTVTETVPAGLNATSITGVNWVCTQPAGPCTRSDILPAGASYPAIILTVNVATNVASTVTNTVRVSGGGEGNTTNNTASDPTGIISPPPLSVSFRVAPSYATSASPDSIAIGDFNGDGKPDLVVANASGNVSVFLGNGNGSFQPALKFVAGTSPSGVAIGDFNGDGKPDLAVSNSSSNDVSILLGNGDGTFQKAVNYAAGMSPAYVSVGDFNGDGKLDFAVANNGDFVGNNAGVSVLLGNGNGTFQAAVNYAAGRACAFVGVADLNGDGKADLVVANANSGNVSTLIGIGDGTFQPAVMYAAGSNPTSVAIADFNGDGKLDLAVANSFSGNVSVLIGKGNGTFNPAVNYALDAGTISVHPYSVVAGDFTGDGKLDLVVAKSTDSTVAILAGNGNGTFQAPKQFAAGSAPWSIAAADFNQDGKLDFAVANNESASISVFIGDGNGQFQAAPLVKASLRQQNLVVGDFNGDGKPDIATLGQYDRAVVVLLGNGDATFQNPLSTFFGGFDDPTYMALGDFNGDGKLDLAVTMDSGAVSILLGNGAGTFQAPTSYPAGTFPSGVAVGDFNGDGKQDIVIANNGSSNVSVLLGNGNGTFQTAANYATGTNTRAVAVGDFNADGKLDLAVARASGIGILLGNGDGTFQAAVNYATGVGSWALAVGDLNGDGKPDIVAVNNFSNDVSVLLSNGNGTFQAAVNYAIASQPQAVTLADLNGDGKLDVAVASPYGGVGKAGNQVTLLGNGDGSLQPAIPYTVPSPQAIVARDFNGDGKPDLVVADMEEAWIALLLNTTPPVTTITNVTSSTANGTYHAGATVSIQVSFSGSVNVSGTPLLALNSGGSAAYSSGTGSATLTFTYVVATGQNSSHLDYSSIGALTTNGGSITDSKSLAAELTLSSPGSSGSLGANKSIVIATPLPTITLSRTSLNFGVNGATTTGPQSVTLSFSSAGIAWTASSNKSNIIVNPASGNGNSTLTVSVSGGSSGTIAIVAPGTGNSPQQITVNVTNVTSGAPFGSFDTPLNNAAGIAGAIPITGWALDSIEVTKVDIWREPVGNEPPGLVYIGDAVFVAGARPDVEALYPNLPGSYRAGWGYLALTNFLPPSGNNTLSGNGVYRIHAIAHNKAGVSLDLGTKTITADNLHAVNPFGTIDTPGQGGTAAGNNFINFGWALTSNPKCIPTDGSTITVYIDGVPVGHPTYNQNRSDIATLFPGRCNSTGAVGYYFIDTTQYSNGIHTIQWVAYDNAGKGDGLGSRYISIFNTSTSSAPPDLPLIEARNVPEQLEVEELARIELPVGAVSGYSLIAGERRPLPIGSTLKAGVFYWHLGPGFLGRHHLVFVLPGGEEVQLNVAIHAKRPARLDP